MEISDILNIVTTSTIVGTFLFGLYNLCSLIKREGDTREHNIEMSYYMNSINLW